MRHGIATERSDDAPETDEERPLTTQGTDRTRKAVQGLAVLKVAPQLILTSPHLRARQTAELVAEGLGIAHKRVVPSDALLPGSDPHALFEALQECKETEILCTGHAPHLDRALALALGASRQAVSQLKKAGTASLELVRYLPPRGHLLWLLEPGALRRLGRSGR